MGLILCTPLRLISENPEQENMKLRNVSMSSSNVINHRAANTTEPRILARSTKILKLLNNKHLK
jgi:hypothetical protein